MRLDDAVSFLDPVKRDENKLRGSLDYMTTFIVTKSTIMDEKIPHETDDRLVHDVRREKSEYVYVLLCHYCSISDHNTF